MCNFKFHSFVMYPSNFQYNNLEYRVQIFRASKYHILEMSSVYNVQRRVRGRLNSKGRSKRNRGGKTNRLQITL